MEEHVFQVYQSRLKAFNRPSEGPALSSATLKNIIRGRNLHVGQSLGLVEWIVHLKFMQVMRVCRSDAAAALTCSWRNRSTLILIITAVFTDYGTAFAFPKRIVSMAETIFTVTGLNMHSRDSDWLILLHCFHSDSPHTERGCQLKSLNKSQPGRKVRSKKQRTFTQESTRDSQCSDPQQTDTQVPGTLQCWCYF